MRLEAGRSDELGKMFRGKDPGAMLETGMGERVMKCTVSLGSKAKHLNKL